MADDSAALPLSVAKSEVFSSRVPSMTSGPTACETLSND